MKKETVFKFQENSFDCLRLCAALQIALTHYLNLIYSHYEAVGAADMFMLWGKRALSFFPGLIILFSISGFLMGNTLERVGEKKQFVKKRFLRIYPGLWINMIVMVIYILILLRPAGEAVRSLFLWGCVQFLGFAYTPDFLNTFATGSINGTLWTVMVEIQFYLLLCLFWKYLKKKSKSWWLELFVFSAAVNLICWFFLEYDFLPNGIDKLIQRSCLPYMVWFAAGLCLYQFKEKIVPKLVRMLPYLTGIFILYKWLELYFGWRFPGYYMDIVTSLVLPCLVIGSAYAFGSHRWKNDFSYGIFLYHWPVINIIFYLNLPEKINHTVLLAGYILCFGLLSCASWFLVERRILKR